MKKDEVVHVMESFSQKVDLISLYQLLNEEIKQYQGLIQNLKEEARYLREGQVEPLIKAVRSVEERVDQIWGIEEKLKELLKRIRLNNSEQGGSLSFPEIDSTVSKEDLIKLKELQIKLNQSKEIVKRVNESNKRFAHEYLSILSEIISSMISPNQERLLYNRHGGKKITHPYVASLDREI